MRLLLVDNNGNVLDEYDIEDYSDIFEQLAQGTPYYSKISDILSEIDEERFYTK